MALQLEPSQPPLGDSVSLYTLHMGVQTQLIQTLKTQYFELEKRANQQRFELEQAQGELKRANNENSRLKQKIQEIE